MVTPSKPRVLAPPRFLPRVASVAVIVIAGLALLGWTINNTTLKSIYPGLVQMDPMSAIAFVLAGIALWRLLNPPPKRAGRGLRRGVAQGLGAGVALLGLLKLGEYLVGWEVGIEHLLFREKLEAATGFSGHMAPNTALCFVLVGLALLFFDVEIRPEHRPAQWLTLGAGLVSALAVIGYAYGMTSLLGPGNYRPMALNTAMAFVLLCTGILSAQADRGLVKIFLADSPGGVLARRLFPAAITISVALGWLRLGGERAGLYDAAFGAALYAAANIVVFAALLYWTAFSLDRLDAERKRAEAALREKEARLRRLVESNIIGIILADTQGHILEANNEFLRMVGYTRDDLLAGKIRWDDMTPPEYREKDRQALEEIRASGVCTPFEKEYIRQDGSRVPILMGTALLEGSRQDCVCFVLDITKRKRAEKALEAQKAELARSNVELAAINKELDAFTYSVSHDLRAPLRQVDGFSRILQEELGDGLVPEARHCLERIQEGVQKMGHLVDDLLNLGRVGRKQLAWERIALHTLVKEALAELEPETKGRTIEWQIEELPSVECDPGLLKLVFVNLLSNAVKFTQHQERAVIHVGHTMENGEPVFFVRDNGVGFNMRYARKLFGIFQRLHRQEDFPGTGVGLANVQRIVHKHGGRVWADSVPYKGATFYFTLGAPERESELAAPGGGAWQSTR